MKLFRNAEFRKMYMVAAIVAAVACGLAFCWELRFGILMAAVCAAFLLFFYQSTKLRYERIGDLAAEIDKLLHGEERVSFAQYTEGELAVLQSEVYKMTVRLREQRERLQEDKIYLADSLADISHQIRTPLTSINLLLSFLADANTGQERRREILRELYSLLSRIDWLITTLLKISKLDAGTVQFKREELPLSELAAKAAAPLLVSMELRGQTFRTAGEGVFSGDAAWTCEAITNIVKNCMEHTPEGGHIHISASENALYSELVITDTGHGIAPEDLPHVFERFYKGAQSGDKSFGIGLALARMIITAQNGSVKAENGADGGAKFTVRFYKGIV